MANPYEQFAATTAKIAETWNPENVPRLRHSFANPYECAGSSLIKQANQANQAFLNLPIPLGTYVHFRFIHIAARTAREAGVEFEDLTQALQHPDSFAKNLGVVAANPISVATKLELSIGVRHPLGYTDPDILPYSIGEAVTIPNLDLRLREIKADTDAEEEKPLTALGKCPAHRWLPDVYQNIVNIALNDPNLVRRTLDNPEPPPAPATPNFRVIASYYD